MKIHPYNQETELKNGVAEGGGCDWSFARSNLLNKLSLVVAPLSALILRQFRCLNPWPRLRRVNLPGVAGKQKDGTKCCMQVISIQSFIQIEEGKYERPNYETAGQNLGVIGLGCTGRSRTYGKAVCEVDGIHLIQSAYEMEYRFFDTVAVYRERLQKEIFPSMQCWLVKLSIMYGIRL